MELKRAFLKPIHQYAFRHKEGVYGAIVGVGFYTPEGYDERLCYKVSWYDMIDYVVVSDVESGHYEIVKTIS